MHICRPTVDDEWDQTATVLLEYVEWMREAAGFDPFTAQPALVGELDHLAAHYEHPDRHLFVAICATLVVGTIAVQLHADSSAELKRMYVRPVARGLGVADALIAHALAEASRAGCDRAWLESVDGAMDAAIAVYRRNGFVDADERVGTLHLDGLVILERDLAFVSRG